MNQLLVRSSSKSTTNAQHSKLQSQIYQIIQDTPSLEHEYQTIQTKINSISQHVFRVQSQYRHTVMQNSTLSQVIEAGRRKLNTLAQNIESISIDSNLIQQDSSHITERSHGIQSSFHFLSREHQHMTNNAQHVHHEKQQLETYVSQIREQYVLHQNRYLMLSEDFHSSFDRYQTHKIEFEKRDRQVTKVTEKNQVLQGQYQALVATRQELKKIFQELELESTDIDLKIDLHDQQAKDQLDHIHAAIQVEKTQLQAYHVHPNTATDRGFGDLSSDDQEIALLTSQIKSSKDRHTALEHTRASYVHSNQDLIETLSTLQAKLQSKSAMVNLWKNKLFSCREVLNDRLQEVLSNEQAFDQIKTWYENQMTKSAAKQEQLEDQLRAVRLKDGDDSTAAKKAEDTAHQIQNLKSKLDTMTSQLQAKQNQHVILSSTYLDLKSGTYHQSLQKRVSDQKKFIQTAIESRENQDMQIEDCNMRLWILEKRIISLQKGQGHRTSGSSSLKTVFQTARWRDICTYCRPAKQKMTKQMVLELDLEELIQRMSSAVSRHREKSTCSQEFEKAQLQQVSEKYNAILESSAAKHETFISAKSHEMQQLSLSIQKMEQQRQTQKQQDQEDDAAAAAAAAISAAPVAQIMGQKGREKKLVKKKSRATRSNDTSNTKSKSSIRNERRRDEKDPIISVSKTSHAKGSRGKKPKAVAKHSQVLQNNKENIAPPTTTTHTTMTGRVKKSKRKEKKKSASTTVKQSSHVSSADDWLLDDLFTFE